MSRRYCYWSVATGPYAALMERCVASARRSGVFKEFHVLTDRPIEGCESYDAQTVEMTDGLFKLIYLKAGMSKLLFDYFIWIDADSLFVRNPRNLLDCLCKSPIHVPLTTNLSANAARPSRRLSERDITSDTIASAPASSARAGKTPDLPAGSSAKNQSLRVPDPAQYVGLMTAAGVYNQVYLSGSAFWIVQRDAIDRVVDLATQFRAAARERGFAADVSACLGYAMQMLCANPEAHRVEARPDLWANDDHGLFNEAWEDAAGAPRPRPGDEASPPPCIIHLPHLMQRGEREELNNGDSQPAKTKTEELEYASR